MEDAVMTISWEHIPGILGFALYATNYLALCSGRLNGTEMRYFVQNGLAALLVLYGLHLDFNLGAALVQVFYVLASVAAILTRLRRTEPAAVSASVSA